MEFPYNPISKIENFKFWTWWLFIVFRSSSTLIRTRNDCNPRLTRNLKCQKSSEFCINLCIRMIPCDWADSESPTRGPGRPWRPLCSGSYAARSVVHPFSEMLIQSSKFKNVVPIQVFFYRIWHVVPGWRLLRKRIRAVSNLWKCILCASSGRRQK